MQKKAGSTFYLNVLHCQVMQHEQQFERHGMTAKIWLITKKKHLKDDALTI